MTIIAAIGAAVFAKIFLTETDQREGKWQELFVKALNKELKSKFKSMGWEWRDRGWDLDIKSPEYNLVLHFVDGKVGYLLAGYTLSSNRNAAAKRVRTRTFANNKELLDAIAQSYSDLQEETGALLEEGRSGTVKLRTFLIAAGISTEDGYFEVPKGYSIWSPYKLDGKSEYKFAIIYTVVKLPGLEEAKKEAEVLNRKIMDNWQDGYFPINVTGIDMDTGTPFQLTSGTRAGYLGYDQGNDQRWGLTKDLVKRMKVKAAIGDMEAEGAEAYDSTQPTVYFVPMDPIVPLVGWLAGDEVASDSEDITQELADQNNALVAGMNDMMGNPAGQSDVMRQMRYLFGSLAADMKVSPLVLSQMLTGEFNFEKAKQ